MCGGGEGEYLSGPLFLIGAFGKGNIFGVYSSCVSCTLFYVDAAEGRLVGLGVGWLPSHRAPSVYMCHSLVSTWVWVAFFTRYECLSSSGGFFRASLEPESWVPESSRSPSSASAS